MKFEVILSFVRLLTFPTVSLSLGTGVVLDNK